MGEAVKAVVQLKAGESCDESVLIELCKQELGSVKRPRVSILLKTCREAPPVKYLKRICERPTGTGRQEQSTDS